MAVNPVRQRYALGTGGALQQTDTRNVTPIKYGRGGAVSAYKVGTNMNGKRVTSTDKLNPPGSRFIPKNARSGPQAVMTTAAKNMGNIPTTTLTQKGSQIPAGFKRHIAKKI